MADFAATWPQAALLSGALHLGTESPRKWTVTESIVVLGRGLLGQDRADDRSITRMLPTQPKGSKGHGRRSGRDWAVLHRGGNRLELRRLFALSQGKLLRQGIISSTRRHNLLPSAYERLENRLFKWATFLWRQDNGKGGGCLGLSWYLWSISNETHSPGKRNSFVLHHRCLKIFQYLHKA